VRWYIWGEYKLEGNANCIWCRGWCTIIMKTSWNWRERELNLELEIGGGKLEWEGPTSARTRIGGNVHLELYLVRQPQELELELPIVSRSLVLVRQHEELQLGGTRIGGKRELEGNANWNCRGTQVCGAVPPT